MATATKEARDMFRRLHRGLAREGLGSDETTKKLLSFLPETLSKQLDNGKKRIAVDVGCGTGPGTKVLCECLDRDVWDICGVDLEDDYLECLPEGVERIKLDMRKLDSRFEPGSIDLILCEGAAYSIGGVHEAGKIWHSLLKENGLLLASDLCWCYDEKPATRKGESLWKEEYPEMKHVASVVDALRFDTPGYEVLGTWGSSDADADNYYIPLQERVEMLRKTEPLSADAEGVLDSHAREYQEWLDQRENREQGMQFNYMQFACRKRTDLAIPNWWRCISRRIDLMMEDLIAAGIIESAKKPQKIADVGCGRGEFAHVMTKMGHSAHGFDLSKTMLTDARDLSSEIPFTEFDLQKDVPAPEHREQFDGAWSAYVASYFPGEEKLAAFIDSCGRFVKSGGWIYILEIDGFFSIHEPLSAATKEKLSKYELETWPAGGYDPYAGGKIKEVVAKKLSGRYKVIQTYELSDDEICGSGPLWHNDILRSWEARWDRPLIGLKSFLGDEQYAMIREEFLAALTHADHSIQDDSQNVKAILLQKL